MPISADQETVKAIRFTQEAVQHSRESIQLMQTAIAKSDRAIELTKERLRPHHRPRRLERSEPER